MPRSFLGRSLTACFAVAAAATTAAQGPAAPPRPTVADPLDAAAVAPPIVHRPVLTPTPTTAGEPLTWREANDRVGRIGGWRAYAREAAAPDAAASAPMPHLHRSAAPPGGPR